MGAGMNELLFDTPLWILLGLVGVGVTVFLVGNNRVNTQIRLAGLVALLLGMTLWLSSYFIETFKEKCESRTHDIADAVDAQDCDGLGRLIDTGTQFGGLRGRGMSKILETAASEIGFKGLTVIGTTTQATDATADVSLRVLAEVNTSVPPTTWLFQYEKRSDGILLSRIRYVPDQSDLTEEQMERRLGAR